MTTWQQAVHELTKANTPYVLATIIETSGSTPRDTGGKMVVTEDCQFDTLGGGQLELLVSETAQQLLTGAQDTQLTRKYPLAAAAMQCCGGSVTVLYETFGLARLPVTIFGAGHIGSRVSALLDELPAFTTVVDARTELLDDVIADRKVDTDALAAARTVDPRSVVLIMTHDHLLDYQLIAELLPRTDLRMLGLIGSATKWQNFQRRLQRDGFSELELNRVTCPIGLAEVPGKTPMAVAVSVVAQILANMDEETAAATPDPQAARAT